jgi:catechol 2,3-dioxygenase-like lactoylglutathione lyase family enzyme
MIDHVGLLVSDYQQSRAFFSRALSPFGYSILMEHEDWGGGFGRDGKPDFWIRKGQAGTQVHVAFASGDRATVDAFHEAAIAAGGTDNGPPGLRTHYHPSYYAAFVLDPDGNNIEAVCHAPE